MSIKDLDFNKAFDTVSHKILTEKLLLNRLDVQTVKWTESYQNGFSRGWWSVAQSLIEGQCTQGSILHPVLFNIFINDLDDGAEGTFSAFAEDTKLEGVADTPEGCVAIQKDLVRLEKWSGRSLIWFNERNCKILQ